MGLHPLCSQGFAKLPGGLKPTRAEPMRAAGNGNEPITVQYQLRNGGRQNHLLCHPLGPLGLLLKFKTSDQMAPWVLIVGDAGALVPVQGVVHAQSTHLGVGAGQLDAANLASQLG